MCQCILIISESLLCSNLLITNSKQEEIRLPFPRWSSQNFRQVVMRLGSSCHWPTNYVSLFQCSPQRYSLCEKSVKSIK